MNFQPAIFPLFVLQVVGAFWHARQRAIYLADKTGVPLSSLPRHYGYYGAVFVFIPLACTFLITGLSKTYITDMIAFSALVERGLSDQEILLIKAKVKLILAGARVGDPTGILAKQAEALAEWQMLFSHVRLFLIFIVGIISYALVIRKIKPSLPARARFDRALSLGLFLSAAGAILTTVGIIFSLALETGQFFSVVSISDFLFGTQWSPQTALREDQIGASGSFGALPLFAGTVLISLIALLFATPIGLLTAIYLNQYAGPGLRGFVKPLLEILAGIPTVVFGFFAAVTIAPLIVSSGNTLGLPTTSESALIAGLVMGLMIIPYISSLSDDAMNTVPSSISEGSLALGATRSETILYVLLPAARPGLFAAMLLAVSRAIGETMIVVMAAGLRPNLTANPFESVTTVTVQIVALLTGDQSFDQPKTLSAFALGLVLFFSTLLFNLIAQRLIKRPDYRMGDSAA